MIVESAEGPAPSEALHIVVGWVLQFAGALPTVGAASGRDFRYQRDASGSVSEFGFCGAGLDQLIFEHETLFQAQPEVRQQRREFFG